jgi:hypothetical protein
MIDVFPLTLREYAMAEVPLAEIVRAVFDFLRDRPDAVVVGAPAVNVYVDPPRMTEDVDVVSTDAAGLAEDLRERLAQSLRIAARTRVVARGLSWRVYQLSRPKNRNLVDVRQVRKLPRVRLCGGVQVVAPSELVLLKLASYADRKRTDKGLTDRVDLHRLLWAMPSLSGPVAEQLERAPVEVRRAWEEIRDEPIEPSSDEDY